MQSEKIRFATECSSATINNLLSTVCFRIERLYGILFLGRFLESQVLIRRVHQIYNKLYKVFIKCRGRNKLINYKFVVGVKTPLLRTELLTTKM